MTTLIVYDTTLERLDREKRISAMPGDVLQKSAAGVHRGDFDVILASPALDPDAVYVTRGNDEEAWNEVKEDLFLRYGDERVRTISMAPEILEVKGDSRLLLEPDYRAKTPMMQAPLGLSVKELREVKGNGFYIAVRPQNYLPYTQKGVDSLFARIDKAGVQVTTYIPCGTDVIGFPADIEYMGRKLRERNIRLGLLEHVTQLQFAKFAGLDALLRSVDNNAVRVLNIDAQENSKLMMPDALRRWALADEERNIRINYVRLFLKPQNGVDIIDLNLDYMRQITQQVKGRGYKIGVAGVFQKPGDTDASANGNPGFTGSYDPDRKALLLVALGAWSALALYMGMILPSCKGTKQYLLVIAGMLITAYSLFMGRGLSIRQGLAFPGYAGFIVAGTLRRAVPAIPVEAFHDEVRRRYRHGERDIRIIGSGNEGQHARRGRADDPDLIAAPGTQEGDGLSKPFQRVVMMAIVLSVRGHGQGMKPLAMQPFRAARRHAVGGGIAQHQDHRAVRRLFRIRIPGPAEAVLFS